MPTAPTPTANSYAPPPSLDAAVIPSMAPLTQPPLTPPPVLLPPAQTPPEPRPPLAPPPVRLCSSNVRAVSSSSPWRKHPCDRVRVAMRDVCEDLLTQFLLGLLTTFYLLMVLFDLIFDEIFCDDRSAEALALRDVKDRVILRLDFIFIALFFCENLLRVFASRCGPFFSSWINSVRQPRREHDALLCATPRLARPRTAVRGWRRLTLSSSSSP